jgi:FKBP-type peptidyl-prolyl cis-trans isomerase
MGKKSISGLKIEDLIEGTGAAAARGSTVTVQAIGTLNKG